MKTVFNSIHKFENRFDKRVDYFVCHHHFFAYLVTFIAMPILILFAVAGGTVAIGFPLAWLCGLL